MKFDVTCDANLESGLNELLNELYDSGFNAYFSDRIYDNSGIELFVVLMCRDPNLNFKQRIRFSKKDNCLYMDVMLDLAIMKQVDFVSRKKIVATKLVMEVPNIIASYRQLKFDFISFKSDLTSWFEHLDWMDSPG